MTVSSDTNKISYAGDGSVTVFSTSFSFAANTEVSITLVTDSTGAESTWVEGTQYTLTGAASGGAGSVTVSTAPTDYTPQTGYSLIISLKPAYTQTRALPRAGTISPKDILEPMADKSTRQILRLKDSVDRSIKAPLAEASIGDMPQKSLRKGYLLGFDPTSGDPVVSSQTTAVIEAGSTNAAASAAAAALSALAAAADKTAADADVVLTNADVVSAGNSATAAAGSAVSAAASAAGIYWKEPCLVRSTGNLTLSGEQTIDGVLTSASRVLAMDQTAAAENGVYVTAAGAWARAAPMDTWDEFVGAVVTVSQGTVNADTAWICTVDAGGTLDTTAITWINFATGGVLAANNGSDFSSVSATLSNLGGIGAATAATLTNKILDANDTGNNLSNIDIANCIAASQAEAEAGTDNTKILTALRVKQAIAALGAGKVTPVRASNVVDTVLARQSVGGTLLFDWGVQTVPVTGGFVISVDRLEFDETGGLNTGNAGFGVKVGTDAIIWSVSRRNIDSFRPLIGIGASATGYQIRDGVDDATYWMQMYFDISANLMSTGAQNISLYCGDGVNSTLGFITITGTTYEGVSTLKIFDET